MRFISRLLRIQTQAESEPSPGASNSENTSPHRMDAEGYPAWLPQRPPPPAPASTVRSSTMDVTTVQDAGAGPSSSHPPSSYFGGRRATPRSVRIVSMQDSEEEKEGRRVPTDHTRVGGSTPRVWSRATGAALSPTVFSSSDLSRLQPKFRSRGFNIDLLRNPSPFARVYFYLFRVFIFAHLFLQTFFDFNAVFIIIHVAPGVPGSGKNWAFGAAAYIACWFLQLAGVFLIYELLYSFRPSIYPLYFSSPAFNFVSTLSFRNFCFLHYLRYAAASANGLAETFWFYAQNLPTVALLLPRPQGGRGRCLLMQGSITGTGPFFRSDGALTRYARGVLLANAAWTAWRTLVLFLSCGHGCAGFCGPRDRWEEEDCGEDRSQSGEECTKARIQEAYDFCLTIKRPPRRKDLGGMDQIMAAVGMSSTVPQSRRGVLSDDLFTGPKGDSEPAEASTSGDDEKVPFPPSPSLPSEEKATTEKETTGDDDDNDGDADEEGEDVGHAELGVVGSDRRSSGRGSGSMSSLGHPVSSRYPFQFRKPTRGTSASSGSPPHSTTNRSIHSHVSQSTGNVDSSSSHSPRSHYSTSSDAASPRSMVLPLPPRHPNRSRAGTVPSSSSPSSPSSPRARTRTSSSAALSFGGPQPVLSSSDLEEDEAEDVIEEGDTLDQPEAAENEDVVGLLTLESSPRLPFIPLSTPSHRSSRSNSQSGSSSRSRAGSLSAIRSRTQSLMHNISATSLELVQRARVDSSMARLEEDPTHSRSGSSTDPSGSGSGGENWTQEMRERRAQQQEEEEEAGVEEFEYVRGQQPSPVIERDSESESSHSSVPIVVHESPYMSATSLSPPSVFRPRGHPDISTAAASFVTAPATIEGSTTEESVRTVSTIGAFPRYGPM
ncbi:hypothetical protein F5146DRAFT_1075315 [Armillaria mellea]|nr:hypothetical protein F5146DRAFT_1075315 [Armillaria mellea]